MRGIFVTGTDTDAGKTLICAALMAGSPSNWRYWKPVQTGLDSDPGDTATVTRLARLGPSQILDAGVRLGPPASPHYAARVTGEVISVPQLVGLGARGPADTFWVAEGAGGLLVPLDDHALQTDLVAVLDLAVVVVVRVRLGAINHALLTDTVLAAKGLRGLGFVLSGPADPSLESALASHARMPVLARVPELGPDADLRAIGAGLRAAVGGLAF